MVGDVTKGMQTSDIRAKTNISREALPGAELERVAHRSHCHFIDSQLDTLGFVVMGLAGVDGAEVAFISG